MSCQGRAQDSRKDELGSDWLGATWEEVRMNM